MNWRDRAKQTVEKKEGVSPPTKPTKPHFVSSVSSHPAHLQEKFAPYTLADLEEMDRLLKQLADMEGWSADELADKLDQRKRMAPVNVMPVLREIRAAHKAAMAVWPEKPKQRSNLRLCKLEAVELAVIDGGKS